MAEFDQDMAVNRPLRMLVVEDMKMNQIIARKFLALYGYRADYASNGLEAIEALERQDYDIVFMDVQMPEMDGEQATRAIREKFPLEKQPWIVAMTAQALRGDREHLLDAGMNDYISKPLDIDELLQVLMRVPDDKRK